MTEQTIPVGKYTYTMLDLHPRDGVRWAVGRKGGRRSATWRLWGHKKGDAYLAMRSLGAHIKVSFHRDRRCNVGFTSEFAAEGKETFGIEPRHWHRWKLPDAPVARAFQVVIPDSDLATFDEDDAEPMAWIPSPGNGRAIVFTVLIAEPPDSFRWSSPDKDGTLLGFMGCPTRMTWLVHHSQELDAGTYGMIDRERRRAASHAGAKLGHAALMDGRMVLWGHPNASNACPYFIETDAATLQSQAAE